MEKISREQLDLALDSLIDQRIEEKGTLRISMACCYFPAGPPICRWDDIPGKHICAKCGNTFGDPEKKGEDVRFGTDTDDGDITVEEWDVEEVLKAYRSCRKAGYDVELDVHCSKCVKGYGLELAVFRFRAPGKDHYAVSFPLFRSGFYPREKRPSDKHFHSWQYALVADFLTRSVKKTADRKDTWCRWMDRMAEIIDERGSDPWVPVGESIKGILGISLEESKQ